MARHMRWGVNLKRPGRMPAVLLLCATLLSCERNPERRIPPDRAPKPQTGAVAPRTGVQSAVYSYIGRPAPLYRPETPIPVRQAVVRT